MTVSSQDCSKTVKHLLKIRFGISERLIKKLKYSGAILLNSVPVHIDARPSEGDILEVLLEQDEKNEDIIPEKMDLDIIYEDDCLIAINKPPNMVVHPTCSHFTGTIANGLKYHLLQKGIRTLIRPVSRLDRDTSGVIVFALNPYVQDCLVRQMKSNIYKKEYIGIVHGIMPSDSGTIDLPIKRLEGSIMLRHVSEDGVPCVTRYEVIQQFDNAAYLKFRLETGRTHQIRVHCQAIGHPLLGDTLYTLPEYEKIHMDLIGRQALHSIRTVFSHSLSNEQVTLEAPVPEDIKHVLEILKK